jgi:hypothetical protein
MGHVLQNNNYILFSRLRSYVYIDMKKKPGKQKQLKCPNK